MYGTVFKSNPYRVRQRSQVLGNKTEMEITRLVEQNPTLLRLGLHLEYSDARHRVASHLQRNIDRSEYAVGRLVARLVVRFNERSVARLMVGSVAGLEFTRNC